MNMSEENNTQASDVSSESSSETQGSPAKETSSESSTETQATPKKEQYVPYERFQEIIQQKNEFEKRLAEHDKRYKDLESRMSRPKETPKENPLMSRLKTVDPEFGTWAEQQEAVRSQLEELKQWKTAAEQEKLKSSVESTIEKLHSEYKVPSEMQKTYKALLQQEVLEIESGGRMLTVADLAGVYKSIHENLNKYFEIQKRANIANYASSKKQDAAIPSVKKGAAPKTAPTKSTFSKDPETARAEIVSRALKTMRANNNSQA